MTTRTIESFPEDLRRRLQEAAARNGRSLNAEVIRRLEASLRAGPVDIAEFLHRARAVRAQAPLSYLTDTVLANARAEGRA